MKKILLCLGAAALAFAAGELYVRANPPAIVYMHTRNVVQFMYPQASPNPYMDYIPPANLDAPFNNHEFQTRVKTNSFNMRGREYSMEKPAGIKRIAVMGDSFVFGWGVENEEVFTALLESRLKNTEVLNFGVSGYAAYQELERLKEEGLRFHPDLVLFVCQSFPDGYPALEKNVGPQPAHEISGLQKAAAFLRRHSRFYLLIHESRPLIEEKIHTLLSPVPQPEPVDQAERIQSGLDVLARLQQLAGKEKFSPVVVYVPPRQAAKEGDSGEADTLRAYCEKNGIPFLDLTPALHDIWKNGKSPYFRIDDHWNRIGHETAAEAVKDFLTKEKLV